MACQIILKKEMDGMEVDIPSYINHSEDFNKFMKN
jgi:hypothetical protein